MSGQDFEHEDYWSRQRSEYTGDACKNCGRHRVEFYPLAKRYVCEKCFWDQGRSDYAYDHHERSA